MTNNYKNWCKKTCFLFAFLAFIFNSFAQKKQAKQFEDIIAQAIKKSYPASVRMWSFDVKQNQRTGNQFSGVVVSADGYILTAAHTITPGLNYKVFFPNGKECIAVALGRIDVTKTPGMPDVGMMKITDRGTWPFAEMGYSNSLIAGEPCLSISYPESLNQQLPTLRVGQVAEVKNEYGFIRSTCKMEPGDSGGPLFDYHGRVIGLHSAIDVAEDQNFEIPVDLYRKYWTALKKEMTYTSFPVLQDSISQDPLALKLITESKQKNLHPKVEDKAKNLSCVMIESSINAEQSQILATLFNYVDEQGNKRQFLITKQSMLGQNPSLALFKNIPLVILARDKENDLALLEVKQRIKGGINLDKISSDTTSVSIGKLISTAKADGTLTNSVLGSDIFMLPKISSRPYLGAMVMYNSKPAQFSLINPDSPAGKAGIVVGDELISINEKTIEKASGFAPAIMKFWPGDEITLSYKNANGTTTKNLILDGVKPAKSNHPVERFEGGKSIRRDGFEKVFSHDAAVKPNECGSPIFDIDGNFLGINIARFSRASTLAVPSAIVLKFINQGL